MSRKALHIGSRTVLAMTCIRCGRFLDGSHFPRYQRSFRDRINYVSRRCRKCWWLHLEMSAGR